MLVQIDGMDEARYNYISANVPPVRVSLQNTITGQPIQVSGCVAWYTHYEAESAGEPAYCRMGIWFDNGDEVGLPAYSDFVNSLRLQTEPVI